MWEILGNSNAMPAGPRSAGRDDNAAGSVERDHPALKQPGGAHENPALPLRQSLEIQGRGATSSARALAASAGERGGLV